MAIMHGAYHHILEAVGHTPIVKLNKVGTHTPAEIYVKCEYLNPGGSTKDRIAIKIIEDAEKRGDLKPGGTIVEATSGNTGMGLALVAAVKGYKTIFVMPDKMSDEKVRAMRALGSKVILTPTNVEADDPRSVYKVAERLAKETPHAVLANQYHNPSNPEAHYISTGPEIWTQTQGDFDVFVAGLGTGGTISGVGRYLKEKKPQIRIIGADPIGSIYYDLWKTGAFKKGTKTSWKVEGIGEDFLPSTIQMKIIDEIIPVTDEDCFYTARDLLRKEGLAAGGSCGAAVAAAIKYAERINQPIKILVLLPDHMSRYLSKYLDDEWMREHGFLGQPQLGTVDSLIQAKNQGQKAKPITVVQAQNTLNQVIKVMRDHGFSQIPVMEQDKLIGVVHETDILRCLVQNGTKKVESPVLELAQVNYIAVKKDTPLASIPAFLNQGKTVLVMDQGQVTGIVSKIDMIEYFADKLTIA